MLGKHAPELVIAGPWDPRFPEAQQRAAELSVSERVRWLGPVAEADLPALYGGSAGFVFPSLYEGFGLPVLEAMACGTPVLCSSSSSLPEVAGDAAIQFEPHSAGGIAAAVARLIQEPNLADDLAERGLARSALFTWEETTRQHLALYRQTIDEA